MVTLCASFVPQTPAQQFTQILDPNNPVVQDQFESGGGCWIDINNDGYLDLFVANGNLTSQNNSLYLNDRSGGFIKVTTGAVVNNGGTSIGATFGDYNRDGNIDLFVTNRNNFGNFLFLGTGDTIFTQVTSEPPATDIANSNMSSWIDIDNDGNLDLHVINFQGNNFWYRNSGPPLYAFSRIDSSSIVTDSSAFSIPGLWGDVNNDRLPDLFVGNAGAENDVLHTNGDNSTFSTSTFNDGRATLGASWGDYDNDGDLDLFVAHYLGQDNRLYRNGGAPSYQLVPVDTGIVSNDAGNSVGTAWGDYDNDGDLDLFVANDVQDNLLYENLGPPAYAFRKVSGEPPTLGGGNSFGAVWGDYDHDGDLDLLVANRLNQKNFLYRNNGNSNAWLIVHCVGSFSNAGAIGAKVRVKANIGGQTVWQLREVAGQTGYNSQNLLLHFGLSNATVIDSIIVEWPSGITTYHTNVSVSRYVTVSEDGSISAVTQQHRDVPDRAQLVQNYPNPFNPTTTIRFEVSGKMLIALRVYDLLGRELETLIHEEKDPGSYDISFNGSSLASGIYFYRLEAGKTVHIKKMVILK